MTNERAKEVLQEQIDRYGQEYDAEGIEALNKAIEVLGQQSCDDCISRQAAIDTIMGQPPESHYPSWYAAQIENLPSAQPERKNGKWIVSHIPDSMLWECNQCGFDCGAHSFNFCPNCGAKMDWKDGDG